MSQAMAKWLAQYIDMTSGVACERTFKDVFNLIQSDVIQRALREMDFREVEYMRFHQKRAGGFRHLAKVALAVHRAGYLHKFPRSAVCYQNRKSFCL